MASSGASQIPTKSKSPTSPTTVGPRRMKRVALRFDLRSERPKWGTFGGGSYVVCVRACDGSFFPVSYFGGNPSDLQEVCQSLCPNATVALFSLPFGGVIDEAVSANFEPYTDLPNAQQVRANVRCKLLLPRFRTELGRGPRHSRGEMRSSSARRLGHRGPIKAPVAPAPGPECETRRARVGAGRRRLGRAGGQPRHQRRRHGTEGRPRRDEPRNLGHQIR